MNCICKCHVSQNVCCGECENRCQCVCHIIGVKAYKASNPPQPCCNCTAIMDKGTLTFQDLPKTNQLPIDNELVVRIDKLSRDVSALIHEVFSTQLNRIDALERKQQELEKRLREKEDVNKKPYRCPICAGYTYFTLLHEFPNARKCLTCDGKGVLWG